MNRLILIMFAASALLASGCAGFVTAPVVPPPGLVYTNTKAPLDIDYAGTTFGAKHGSAETINILGLVSMGDVSLKTAAGNGSITTVNHVDYEIFNILGVFSRLTLHAYGD